jgi:hypothetical protein
MSKSTKTTTTKKYKIVDPTRSHGFQTQCKSFKLFQNPLTVTPKQTEPTKPKPQIKRKRNSDQTYVRVNVAMERQNDRKHDAPVAFPNDESCSEKWVELIRREDEWGKRDKKWLWLGLQLLVPRLRIATEAIESRTIRIREPLSLYFVL